MDNEADKIYRQIINSMTPEQKLRQAMNLNYTARELKRAYLKSIYPDLSDEEINEKVKEAFLYART